MLLWLPFNFKWLSAINFLLVYAYPRDLSFKPKGKLIILVDRKKTLTDKIPNVKSKHGTYYANTVAN
jgi:hypothetical protein